MVSGKLPSGKFPYGKFIPIKLPLVNFPSRKFPPGIFSPINLSFIDIKRLLCNSFLKVLKSEIQKSLYQKIFSLPAKMVTYSKKLCWSNLIIGYYYHPPVCFECDVTESINLI